MTVDDISENELFRKMVTISLVLHLSFFIIFFLKSFFIPSQSINLESAIRVDMVALPDKTTELPSKGKSESKEEVKPAEKMPPPSKAEKANLKKEKAMEEAISLKKRQSAMERIKEFEKEERRKKSLENIQNEVKKQESAERGDKARKIIKGNAINAGSTLHGLTKAEFNEYISELHAHVLDHWNLPEWLSNGNLKATVTVYIDGQGKVIKRNLKKSSGDDRFDDYALKAVDEASPFPRPPEKFADRLSTDGFNLGFPE